MITKRYKLPLALVSDLVRDQAQEYMRNPALGLSFTGPAIEQDVSFADGTDATIVASIHDRMLRAGWTFVEDSPTTPPAAVLVDDGGDTRKLTVSGNTLDISSKEADSTLPLPVQKKRREAAIDKLTGDLIVSNGFEFPPGSGQIFSMSNDAQTNLIGLDSGRNDPNVAYPIEFNFQDDSGTFMVQNAATVHMMYLVAMGTKRAWVDSGTALKKAVRSASDQTELDAIIDDRV